MSSGWDFAKAEAGIVETLKAAIQSGPEAWARAVGTRADIETIEEEQQLAPAVYVVYDGFSVAEADVSTAVLVHRWLVVIAVASAQATRESAPRNRLAGPFMRDVLAALHGVTPPDCNEPLVPITPPRPYFSDARFAYYPLAFKTASTHCTDNAFKA